MVKMFVYGDPVLPSKSKESLNFWRHRRQADDYLSKVFSNKTQLLLNNYFFVVVRETQQVQNKNYDVAFKRLVLDCRAVAWSFSWLSCGSSHDSFSIVFG